MKRLTSHAGWAALSLGGALALAYIALNCGESINAIWVVAASVCVYLIAYRFYSCSSPPRCWGWTPRARPRLINSTTG